MAKGDPVSGLTTTEARGEATFDVELDSEPTANVVVGVTSGDETEGRVSPAELTFTSDDWSSAQTVTVTGVDDALGVDVQERFIRSAQAETPGGGQCNRRRHGWLRAAALTLVAGLSWLALPGEAQAQSTAITLSVNPFFVSEGGGTQSVEVTAALVPSNPTLGEPTAVTVSVVTGVAIEGTDFVAVSDFTVTIPSQTASGSATFNLTPVQDALVESSEFVTVSGMAAGFTVYQATLFITDDDPIGGGVGVTVDPVSGLTTTEAGGEATFEVVLDTRPTADVVVGVTSDDETEGTVSPAELTFTSDNWSSAQTVTVTGVDDALDDGDRGYTVVLAAVVSTDTDYQGVDPDDVSVVNTDDDAVGVKVSATGVTVSEGGTANYTVRLNTLPMADVTITVARASGGDTNLTVSPATLTFTAANWSSEQTVTLAAGEDDDTAPGVAVFTHSAASTDTNYNGVAIASVTATEGDNDTDGVRVSPTSGLTTAEGGGEATFEVVLDTPPTADVVVGVTSGDETEGTVSPAELTFTSDNWSSAQTVTVTGVDDALDDGDRGYTVALAAAVSTDTGYQGVDPDDVSVTNTDDDAVGVKVSATGVTVSEGGSANYTVRLESEPTADVTITVAAEAGGDANLTVSPATLTFIAANWSSEQTVTLAAGEDADGVNGSATFTHSAASTDTSYDGIAIASVTATEADNDTAGVKVSATGVTVFEGSTETYTVRLNTQPTANVTITVAVQGVGDVNLTVSGGATLTFTAQTWSTAQTVTLAAGEDADGVNGSAIFTHSAASTDTSYNGIAIVSVTATEGDKDTVGVTVSPISGLTTTEGGGEATYTVRLNTQPTADVVIGVTSGDETEGTVSPAELTFLPDDWSSAQTVTVTGVDDTADDGDVTYTVALAAAVSTDTGYHGVDPDDVSVTNTDDDEIGVTVSPTSGLTTTEGGGEATFEVVLNTPPTADVVVGVTSGDETEGTVSPAELTFTSDNWSSAQTVTVTGVDDALDDGDRGYTVALAAAVSTDTDYQGVDPDDVSVTNTDDDAVGVKVSATAVAVVEGGTATYTVRLDTEPTADVTITVARASGGDTDLAVSPATLTFTAANWSTEQTVTVAAGEDADTVAGVAVFTHSAASTDTAYHRIAIASVTATEGDNDTPGVTVSPTSGLTTTEGGGEATFEVVLNTPPTADVVVGVTSGDETEGTVSPAELTFTSDNWSSAQTVTVTGVDDALDDGDRGYTVALAAAVSTDTGYQGVDPDDVSVTNTDDDGVPTVTLMLSNASISENGGSATVTASLSHGSSAETTVVVSAEPVAPAVASDFDLSANTILSIAVGVTTSTGSMTITAADNNVRRPDKTVMLSGSASNSMGVTAPAEVTLTITDDDPPNAPASLAATQTGAGTVILSWDDPSDASISTYQYRQSTDNGSNWDVDWTDIGDSDATTISHQVAGLTAGTAYTFEVRAVNVVGEGTAASASVTTVDVPDAPASLAATQTGLGAVTLSWDDPGDASISKYQYRRSIGGGTSWAVNWADIAGSGATTTSRQVTGLTAITAYTFEVRAVNAAGEGTAASASASLAAVRVSATAVTVFEGSKWTYSGSTSTYTVRLNTPPTADVTITVAAETGGDPDLTVSGGATLTFTAQNWSTEQTVTLVADEDGDTAPGVAVFTHSAASTDTNYNGVAIASVTATEADNDTVGVKVSPTSGLTTTEGGQRRRFRVRLNKRPTADVVVGVTSDDETEGTVSPAELTFTSANWMNEQTVTVTGVDDALDDGDRGYTVVLGAAASTDTDYQGVDPADVSLTNTDDDEVGVKVSATGVTVSEGSTATYTVRLESEPTADVTITVAAETGGDANLTVSGGATLTFTAQNWSTEQTVTLAAGEDDDTAPGVAVFTHSAASTDTSYNGIAIASVTVTEADNDTPDAPANLAATQTEAVAVTLSWDALGDASIEKIQYRQSTDGGTSWDVDWTDVAGSGATTTSHQVTGLTAGTAYTFEVRAVNVAGGSAAASASLTTANVPDAPSSLVAAHTGEGVVTLSWDDPDDASIEKYQYRRSTDGGTSWDVDWTDIAGSGATTTSHQVTGLTAGIAHTFEVRAVNVAGVGAAALAKPAAPTSLKAYPGAEKITLFWDDPDDASITGWQLSVDGSEFATFIPADVLTVLFHTVWKLTNGTLYTIAVRAVSASGNGASSTVTATPLARPSAPTGLKATAGDGEVSLSWDDPDNNSITSYMVSSDGGSSYDTVSGSTDSTTSHTVTDLTNGTLYTFAVLPVNASGTGYSSTVTATPLAKPSAPTGLKATAGDGEVSLSWDDPGNNSITSYMVSSDGGSWFDTVSGSAASTTSHTVTDLTNGTVYTFAVLAVNASGNGASSTVTATPPNNAPAFPAAETGARSVAENTAPGTDIGAPVAAVDADTADTLSYALGGTDAADFAIVSASGQLPDPVGARLRDPILLLGHRDRLRHHRHRLQGRDHHRHQRGGARGGDSGL